MILGAIMPVLCHARTITGTVLDEKGEPLPGASVQTNLKTGQQTDTDGKYSISDPNGQVNEITISFMGLETKKLSIPGTSDYSAPQTQLKESSKNLSEVVVASSNLEGKDCTNRKTAAEKQSAHATKFIYIKYTDGNTSKYDCVPDDCDPNGYAIKNKGSRDAVCIAQDGCSESEAKTKENATAFKYVDADGKRVCVPDACKPRYQLKGGNTASAFCEELICGGAKQWDENDKCVDMTGKTCIPTTPIDKAKTYIYHWNPSKGELECIVNTCEKNYLPSTDGHSCELSDGDCSEAQIKAIEHATAGALKNKTCYPTECEYGWKPDGMKCTPVAVLSPENAKKQVEDLQKNYDDAKKKEQSLTARLTGAAAIAGTGLGLMDILSGSAEQRADQAAEDDMKAYLETFRCDYGQGMNIHGGDVNIELPGGNDLFDLYVEYAALSESVKTRKNALGLRPGIEAEVIYDKADTGLYDNAAIGKTTGSFASVARAIQDPNGADAAAWAKQKSDAADKLKRGAILAGVGTLVGIGGNIATEAMYGREKSAELRAKYDGLRTIAQDTQIQLDNIPQTDTCAGKVGTTGAGTYPDCECKNENERFARDQGQCVACPGDEVYNDKGQCACPAEKPISGENNTCTAAAESCKLTGLVKDKDSASCTCIENAEEDDNHKCDCKTGYHKDDAGKCVENAQETQPQNTEPEISKISINADTSFDTGKATLKQAGIDALTEFANNVKNWMTENNADIKDFCITVDGHTDRTKFRHDPKNQKNYQLSLDRATAVQKELQKQNMANIWINGYGPDKCPESEPDNSPNCRRVDIKIKEGTTCAD